MEHHKTDIHRDLLVECEKGNKSAQFEIYKLYYKAMYNTCLRIINNKEDAEDIMQESFLTAFQNLRNQREDSSFGAWLKKITINKALDFLKARKMKSVDFDEKSELSDNITDTIDENKIDFEINKIKEAVNLLKENYRIIFNLKAFEGYDHEEIAEILNIKPSTVRSTFTRAKMQLTEILKTKI